MNGPTENKHVRSGSAWPVELTAALTLGLVAATFIQSALSVLSRYVIDDFHLTRAGFGVILSIFGLSGAAAAPFMGRASDVLGGRVVLAGVFVVSALVLLVLAGAPAYAWLLAAGALGGLGLGAGNPATNKLSVVHVTGGHQGAVMGVKQSGPPLGVLIAGVMLPSLAAAVGWRWALTLSALIPIAGLALLLRVMPWDLRNSRPIRRSDLPFRARATVWWLTGIGFLVATGVGGILAFLPLYAQERVGMSTFAAGIMASFVGVVGISARILWSWQGSRFRHLGTPLLAIAVLSVLGTVALWAAASAGSGVLWAGAFVSGISMMAWHGVGWLALVVDVEASAVGGASGVVHLRVIGGVRHRTSGVRRARGPLLLRRGVGSGHDAVPGRHREHRTLALADLSGPSVGWAGRGSARYARLGRGGGLPLARSPEGAMVAGVGPQTSRR